MKLSGLAEEGFGMSWSVKQKGLLAAASGTQLCLWNISNPSHHVLSLTNAHQSTINDIKFSPLSDSLFITAADDSHFKIWDLRSKNFV
jgi:WD40 repeat protein